MKIQQIPLTLIKPYWRNPRDNAGAVDAVKTSIMEFGVNQPLVLDKDNVIVVGHTRYKALMELGHEKAPCVVLTGLDPARVKAYRIADNKTNELAEWDIAKLVPELREISDAVDMEAFFTDGELEKLLADAGGLDVAGASQSDIDAASERASTQFDGIEGVASEKQVPIICVHCGETIFVQAEAVAREAARK
jgi:site-specific DNA-methyltransferase (adenine-specific)